MSTSVRDAIAAHPAAYSSTSVTLPCGTWDGKLSPSTHRNHR
jgi:hypothetical protein